MQDFRIFNWISYSLMIICFDVVYMIVSSFIDLGSQGTLMTSNSYPSDLSTVISLYFLPFFFLFYLPEALIICMFELLTSSKIPFILNFFCNSFINLWDNFSTLWIFPLI